MMILLRSWFAAVLMLIALVPADIMAQDDDSQRLLPFPESGVTDLPQHMELLKRLRSLVESQQETAEPQGSQQKPANRQNRDPETGTRDTDRSEPRQRQEQSTAPEGPEESGPLRPHQFQQLEEALKKLANRLPPGFVPPNLNNIPPEQLRKTIEDPAVQQQMRKMLEQFSKDGVLPPPPTGESSGSEPLPLPPRQGQNVSPRVGRSENPDASSDPPTDGNPAQDANDRPSGGNTREDKATKDNTAEEKIASETARGEKNTAEENAGDGNSSSAPPPAGSMKSLRDFLKRIYEGPAPADNQSTNTAQKDTAQKDTAAAASEKNAGSTSAAPRQPMRRRDRQSGAQPTPAQPNPAQPGTPLQDYGLRDQSGSADGSESESRDGVRSNTGTPRATPENRSGVIAPPVTRNPQPPRPQASGSQAPGSQAPGSQAPGSQAPGSQAPGSPVPGPGSVDVSDLNQQRLEELQDLIEQMKMYSEQQNAEPSPVASESGSDGDSSSRSGTADQSRSDQSRSDQSRSDQTAEMRPEDIESLRGQGAGARSAQKPGSQSRAGGTANSESLNNLPDVSEFLKQQMKDAPIQPSPGNSRGEDRRVENGGTAGSSLDQSPKQNSSRQSGTGRDDPRSQANESRRSRSEGTSETPSGGRKSGERQSGERQSGEKSSGSAQNAGPSSPEGESSPAVESRAAEIRKELERRGFAETLKGIVEKARKESRQPKPATEGVTDSGSAGPSSSDAVPPGSGGGQLSESMNRMLGGLKDEIVEIAKDANFNSPPSPRSGVRSENRSAESNSLLDGFRESASEILAGPSGSAGVRTGSGAMAGSGGSANSFEFDFTPALVLAGLLVAATLGFLAMKHIKLRGGEPVLQFAGSPLQPSEIQSRADVVRAFHEFALRSTRSVQSWWTHRTVVKAISSSAPEKAAAAETLANAYEQARYLPLDQELTEDQIQSARTAFQQCTTHRVKPN